VGLLITSLNLFPIGQLDGGHILYGLLRDRARPVATLVLLGAIAAVFYFKMIWWLVMLFLLVLMGPAHPPTTNDNVPLGPWRTILGWLTLAFLPFGFTPNPLPQ
jgi:Zn-dependent protease